MPGPSFLLLAAGRTLVSPSSGGVAIDKGTAGSWEIPPRLPCSALGRLAAIGGAPSSAVGFSDAAAPLLTRADRGIEANEAKGLQPSAVPAVGLGTCEGPCCCASSSLPPRCTGTKESCPRARPSAAAVTLLLADWCCWDMRLTIAAAAYNHTDNGCID